jgi:membrane-associated phospholipid phosphatase
MLRKGVLRATLAGAALFATALHPSAARAEDSTAHELHYNYGLDIAIIVGSAGIVLGTEYFSFIKPQKCRWCDRDGEKDSLNGLDRSARNAMRWEDPRSAQFASGVTAFLLEPAAVTLEMIAASAVDKATRAFPVDFMIITEAVAVSTLANQMTKLAFARERPFVHGMPSEERLKTVLPSDNNVSFYSGHTALSFTLAAAAGTVASLRGYRLAPLVWGTMMPLAAVTGYLRIAADKHYFTDVMTGAILGTAVGALVPLLLHARDGDIFVPNGTGTGSGPATAGPPGSAVPAMVTLGGGFCSEALLIRSNRRRSTTTSSGRRWPGRSSSGRPGPAFERARRSSLSQRSTRSRET